MPTSPMKASDQIFDRNPATSASTPSISAYTPQISTSVARLRAGHMNDSMPNSSAHTPRKRERGPVPGEGTGYRGIGMSYLHG